MPKHPASRRRILLTLPDLALGGGQRIVLNYLAYRDTDTFDVRILTLHPEPAELADEVADTGVPVTCLHARPGARLETIRRLTSLLRRERIELVHPHGPDDREALLAPCVAARVPMVLHLHSEWNHRGAHLPPGPTPAQRAVGWAKGFVRDRLEDRAVREYLADSPPVADAFRPVARRPVHAMTQSMPFGQLEAARAAHDERAWRAELGLGSGPVAITVSRLAEGKGQDRIIRAMATVRRHVPDAHLLVVGDGELRPVHEALAADLGLADAVHFLGSRRDVPRLLVGADVFAFASATESFGLVVAEAMAAGLAVVALRLPSLAGFTSEETGLFSDQADDDGLARNLATALADRDLARRLGAAGQASVARLFPPRATADSFEAAYRRVLGLTPAGEAEPPAGGSRPDGGRTPNADHDHHRHGNAATAGRDDRDNRDGHGATRGGPPAAVPHGRHTEGAGPAPVATAATAPGTHRYPDGKA